MKNKFDFINNEKGFFLPYVLVIFLILLTLITSSLAIYKNELELTNLFYGQLEAETLLQMAHVRLHEEELFQALENGQVIYTFPVGEVVITIRKSSPTRLDVNYQVVTNDAIELFFNEIIPIEEMDL